MFDYLLLPFAKGTQWICGGIEKVGVRFQQRSVTGSNVRKEDRVRTVAIFRPGKLPYTSVNWLVVDR